VNMAMNLRILRRWENSRSAERLSASQEGHSSMDVKCALVEKLINFMVS
jgi:hypothetical protein